MVSESGKTAVKRALFKYSSSVLVTVAGDWTIL